MHQERRRLIISPHRGICARWLMKVYRVQRPELMPFPIMVKYPFSPLPRADYEIRATTIIYHIYTAQTPSLSRSLLFHVNQTFVRPSAAIHGHPYAQSRILCKTGPHEHRLSPHIKIHSFFFFFFLFRTISNSRPPVFKERRRPQEVQSITIFICFYLFKGKNKNQTNWKPHTEDTLGSINISSWLVREFLT